MHHKTIDSQAIAQFELDQYIEQQSQELAPEFEIDGLVDEDFGNLYRLWKGRQLLGTFYKDAEGKWVAQPCCSDIRPRLKTETQAQLVIIAVNGLGFADAA